MRQHWSKRDKMYLILKLSNTSHGLLRYMLSCDRNSKATKQFPWYVSNSVCWRKPWDVIKALETQTFLKLQINWHGLNKSERGFVTLRTMNGWCEIMSGNVTVNENTIKQKIKLAITTKLKLFYNTEIILKCRFLIWKTVVIRWSGPLFFYLFPSSWLEPRFFSAEMISLTCFPHNLPSPAPDE